MAEETRLLVPPNTLNGIVNIDSLTQQLDADPAILQTVERMSVRDTDFSVWFPAPLDAGGVTAFNAVCAAHTGAPPIVATMAASASIDPGEGLITTDAGWTILGGVVTTTGFFTSNLATVLGRVTLDAKGDGGQIRVCAEEQGQTKISMLTAPYEIVDTLTAWQLQSLSTDVTPPAAAARYTVEARLNGATSLEVRYASLSLLVLS